MEPKRPVGYLCFSAVCFAFAAAAFSLTRPSNTRLFFSTRIAGLVCAILAAVLAVMAMKRIGQEINLKNFKRCGRRPVPMAPVLPAEASLGSLRGAVRALPQFAKTLPNEFCRWQAERAGRALEAILAKTEKENDPAQAAEFATRYLPSAMQFLAACAAEGCPQNGAETLTAIALACEKQQDALAEGSKADFEQEYKQLRSAIETASFCWQK